MHKIHLLNPQYGEKNFITDEEHNHFLGLNIFSYSCKFESQLYSDNLFSAFGVKYNHSLKSAVIKRRAEFLAGRYCAAKCLEFFDVSDFEIKIGMHRNPLWPTEFFGSISHCDSSAIAVCSPKKFCNGIGIDVEKEICSNTIEKIQNLVLSKEEINLISQFSNKRALLFTLMFSVKESFFKAAYHLTKSYFDFDAVSVICINHDKKTIVIKINKDLHHHLKKSTIVNCHFCIDKRHNFITMVVL